MYGWAWELGTVLYYPSLVRVSIAQMTVVKLKKNHRFDSGHVQQAWRSFLATAEEHLAFKLWTLIVDLRINWDMLGILLTF